MRPRGETVERDGGRRPNGRASRICRPANDIAAHHVEAGRAARIVR